MSIRPDDFPNVPKAQRPKPLYVDNNVPAEDVKAFKELGWEVIDVRLMPNRSEAVRATLEGIRTGTVAYTKELLGFLQLEARIEKLLLNRDADEAEEASVFEDGDFDAILSFGTPIELPEKLIKKQSDV